MKRFVAVVIGILLMVPTTSWAPPTGGAGTGFMRNLQDLRDVTKPLSPADNDALIWDSVTSKWIATPQSGGGGTTYNAGNGLDLAGTTFSADNSVLYFDSESTAHAGSASVHHTATTTTLPGVNLSADGDTLDVVDDPVFAGRVKATGFTTTATSGNRYVYVGNTNDYSGTEIGSQWMNETAGVLRYNSAASTAQTVAIASDITAHAGSATVHQTVDLAGHASSTTVHHAEYDISAHAGSATVHQTVDLAGHASSATVHQDLPAHAGSESAHHVPTALFGGDFSDLANSASDAQIPNDITITALSDHVALTTQHFTEGSIEIENIAATGSTGGFAVVSDGANGLAWIELTGGAEVNNLETTTTGITAGFFPLGSGAGVSTYTSLSTIEADRFSATGVTDTWVLASDGANGTEWKADAGGTPANADSATQGIIEVATIAETNTGTSQTLAVSPDAITDWTGSTAITSVGVLTAGTWNATALTDLYIDESTLEAADLQGAHSDEATADSATSGISETATRVETNTGTAVDRVVTPDGLEQWEGSAQVTTLGTIASGTWNATALTDLYIDESTLEAADLQGAHSDESNADSATVGVIRVATLAETATGTSQVLAVSPDGIDAEVVSHTGDTNAHHALNFNVMNGSATSAQIDADMARDSELHTATVAGDLEILDIPATASTVDYVVASDGAGALVWKIDATGSPSFIGTADSDLIMGGIYQVTGLQAPDTAGDAIRYTTNITETALENITDGSETTEHSHAGGSGDMVQSVWDATTDGFIDLDAGGTNIDSSAVTNGQMLIGNTTGNLFALGTITGTATETDVTVGASSLQIGIVASPTLDATNITGGSLHTQGSDTALGAMAEDIDMNTSYQLTALAAPVGAGEAVRTTTNITEAALEAVTDGGETTEHSHAGGTSYWTDSTGYLTVVDDDDIGAVADKVASIYADTITSGVFLTDVADGGRYLQAVNTDGVGSTEGYIAYDNTLNVLEYYDDSGVETIATVASVVDWTSDQGGTDIHSGNYPITDGLLPDAITANAVTGTTGTFDALNLSSVCATNAYQLIYNSSDDSISCVVDASGGATALDDIGDPDNDAVTVITFGSAESLMFTFSSDKSAIFDSTGLTISGTDTTTIYDLAVTTDIVATGTVSGLTNVINTTAATLAVTAAQCAGVIHTTDDDVITWTLPAAAAGLNCSFYSPFANIVTVDLDGSDSFILDGTVLSVGDAIASDGTAGAYVYVMAIDAVQWAVIGKIETWAGP